MKRLLVTVLFSLVAACGGSSDDSTGNVAVDDSSTSSVWNEMTWDEGEWQ